MFNEVDCHYVKGSECDARAARRHNQFCFLVYDALAYSMLDLFSLATACPVFFKDIGDPKKEDIPRVTARQKPVGYGFFRKDESEPIRFKTDLSHPNCEIREQAALYFTGMALDAI
ncbi:MAG: hypothetical protein AAGA21_16420 [Pseudomonadota bacterium]